MIAASLLLFVVVAYRIAFGFAGAGSVDGAWMPNFAPVAAIALCSAMWLPRRIALVLPTAIFLFSDIVLNTLRYHETLFSWEILPRYVALATVTAMGLGLRSHRGWTTALIGVVVGSVAFYVLTNSGSWIGNPAYTKNIAGWIQALTVGTGEAGLPQTWTFFRNSLASDLVFTALFVACFSWKPSAAEPAPAPLPVRG